MFWIVHCQKMEINYSKYSIVRWMPQKKKKKKTREEEEEEVEEGHEYLFLV